MKRALPPILLVLALFTAGVAGVVHVVTGQEAASESFELLLALGGTPPRGIQYNPHLDQMAGVSRTGRFVLIDATTLTETAELYESGTYNAYLYSHDGRRLAVAYNNRVDLWDAQTGDLLTSITPESANSVTGPLLFSEDDRLLGFTAVVPASQATRRSENDTDNLPWVWDIEAALDTEDSILPGRAEAIPFFDYRSGLLFLGSGNKILAALPGRMQILDLNQSDIPVINEIEVERFENDPVDLWVSDSSGAMYLRPQDREALVQINPDGSMLEIPIGRELNAVGLRPYDRLGLGDEARIIGEPSTREENALLRELLGADYRSYRNYHPLTVMLLDVLTPITQTAGEPGLLMYTYDEQTGTGILDFVRPPNARDFAVNPDGTRMAVRGLDDVVTIYDMATGITERRLFPALPDINNDLLFAYNAFGDVLTSGWERFNPLTGEMLVRDLEVNPGYTAWYFTDDGEHLVTLNGDTWWLWDIASETVIRREQRVLEGTLLETSRDGMRFLSVIDSGDGVSRAYHVLDMGQDTRRSVTISAPPNSMLVNVYISPTWEHYLALFSDNFTGEPSIGLYSLDRGQRWFIGAADLPPNTSSGEFGWIDEDTAYIGVFVNPNDRAPERFYGIDAHPSGLPQCLVDAYPDQWESWLPLWERLVSRLTPESLARLTQGLCAAEAQTEVESLFTPTPTRTPAPQPTFSAPVFVDVPVCLTTSYPDQALAFARDWRELTNGLSEEEIENLEILLCEGLSSGAQFAPSGEIEVGTTGFVQYMLLEVETGVRSLVSSLPPQQPEDNRLSRTLEDWEDEFGFFPENPVLSPDGTLLAVRTTNGHVNIYRVANPYPLPRLVENTGVNTASIRLRPTATPLPEVFGQPRPTLTPTITPTSPATPVATVEGVQRDEVIEVCPLERWFSIAEAPTSYQAAGQVLATNLNDPMRMWVLDMQTGQFQPDETLPPCGLNGNCNFTFDQSWMIVYGEDIYVARPDGDERATLFRAGEGVPDAIYWLDNQVLEFAVQGYLPEESTNPFLLYTQYNVETRMYDDPTRFRPSVNVNQLQTELVSSQPQGGSLRLVRTPFNTGTGTGYKYYIYDTLTGEADYFARLASPFNNELSAVWHPLGDALYYRLPNAEDWFVYDVTADEHRIFGELPGGVWSRDGRYRVSSYTLPQDEAVERLENDLPIPNISVWDRETGLTRYYCAPRGGWFSAEQFNWSPDNRYVAFVSPAAPSAEDFETFALSYATVYVLDTQTGVVIEYPANVGSITVWTTEAGE